MARNGRLETHATGQLDRAMMDLLRDTENPVSAAFSHSLLRDFYGTDGFEAVSRKRRPIRGRSRHQTTRSSVRER